MSESPANRPAPSASGTLAKTPLVHLLIYALEKKLGGTIEVVTPDRRMARMLFIGGEPAKVRAHEPPLYLGRVLMDLGQIAEDELSGTLAAQSQAVAGARALVGEMLVTAGILDKTRLEGALREQLARTLRYVASLPPETSYAFYDGFDGLRGWGAEVTRGVDPVPFLWETVRRAAPESHVEAALSRVAGSTLRVSRTADLARLGLRATEQTALEQTRARPATIAEIAGACGIGERDARLLVYLLLVTKQIEVIRTSQAPGEIASTPRAPAVTPPHAFAIAPPRAPAGRAVSVPDERVGAAASRSSAPPPPRTKPPPPPSGLAPALTLRWTEVTERAEVIDRSDYFAMLDIARDATQKDVRDAFLGLAKRWHPDRLPPELAPVREACSRVFARMNEAHATLSDEDRRPRYMRLLADGSGSPEMQDTVAKIVEAATNFQKAEVCFKRQDYVQAETLCRSALKADPTQPDYHAMNAWLLSLKPENQAPEQVTACIQKLDRAIAMSDKCERAYFWRGMLNKRLGKISSAQRDFRHVTELNPHNIDAAREVRLHQMRGGAPATDDSDAVLPGGRAKGDDADKRGLLGRLFKKT